MLLVEKIHNPSNEIHFYTHKRLYIEAIYWLWSILRVLPPHPKLIMSAPRSQNIFSHIINNLLCRTQEHVCSSPFLFNLIDLNSRSKESSLAERSLLYQNYQLIDHSVSVPWRTIHAYFW